MAAEQAAQYVREGKLPEALASLEDAVRNDPASSDNRVFLFQLLSLLGQWDRALNQLGVLQEMDVAMLPLVLLYREAIHSEVFRSETLAGARQPLVFGEPTQWIALLLESLRATAMHHDKEANELRAAGLEMAPAVGGSLICGDEMPVQFDWICDADSRFGPVLEAIIHGKYYWVPFDRVKSIRLGPPTDLRDLIWAPAQFCWTNGGEAAGLIPARYVGSEQSDDSRIRLARLTQWSAAGGGAYNGAGQRMLSTDVDDFPLLQVRQIDLGTSAS